MLYCSNLKTLDRYFYTSTFVFYRDIVFTKRKRKNLDDKSRLDFPELEKRWQNVLKIGSNQSSCVIEVGRSRPTQ